MEAPRRGPLCSLLVTALAIFAAIPDGAAASVRYERGAAAGVSFPVHIGELPDYWNPGVTLAGSFEMVFTPRHRASLEVGFSYFDLKEDELSWWETTRPEFSGYDLWIVPVTLTGSFDLMDRGGTKPFLMAGVGIYTVRTTDLKIDGVAEPKINMNETAFGALGGAGVRTPIGVGFDLCIEVAYHVAFTDGATTLSVPLRLRLIF